MTKTEQAELEELGLTPDQMQARQEKLRELAKGNPISEPFSPPQANGRKRRSDAGTRRPKPEGRTITVRFNVTTERQAQTYAKALRVFLDAGDTANVDAMLTAAMKG